MQVSHPRYNLWDGPGFGVPVIWPSPPHHFAHSTGRHCLVLRHLVAELESIPLPFHVPILIPLRRGLICHCAQSPSAKSCCASTSKASLIRLSVFNTIATWDDPRSRLSDRLSAVFSPFSNLHNTKAGPIPNASSVCPARLQCWRTLTRVWVRPDAPAGLAMPDVTPAAHLLPPLVIVRRGRLYFAQRV